MYDYSFSKNVVETFQEDFPRATELVRLIIKRRTGDVIKAFSFSQPTWECYKFIAKAPSWRYYDLADVLVKWQDIYDNATHLYSLWVRGRIKNLNSYHTRYLTRFFCELSLIPDVVTPDK